MRKMIRQIMTLATLCWMVAGCADEVLNRNGGKGEGCLLLTGIEVESAVGDVQTKASLAEGDLPGITDFTIEVVSKSDGLTVKTLQPGVTHCTLPVGSYLLKASYGDPTALSYTPAFYGETSVTIAPNTDTGAEIKASLLQAVFHPRMSDELVAQFKSYELTLGVAGGEAVLLENDKDVFLPAGNATYELKLIGSNQIGGDVFHTWQYKNLVAKTRYIVVCNPDLPAFTIPDQKENDAWSKFIYITPMTADNMTTHKEMADKVLANIVYEASADGLTWIPSESTVDGQLVIKGLEPSTRYTLRSRFGAVYSSDTKTITTENAAPVPNGDFEELKETVNILGMNQGGKWRATALGSYYQNTCNFTINEPSNWASVNVKTCNANSSNINSWFVIPSTYNTTLSWTGIVPSYGIWGGGGSETPDVYQNLSAQNKANAMVIRNVAWDANGTSPSDDSKTTGSSGYYNRNVPTIANRSAGKLFLGSYSYVNGIESYNEGVGFESRPLILKGFYKYVQDGNDSSETGIVTISLLNENTVIGTASKALTSVSDYTEFEVPIVYSDYSLKATQLRIMITSSNHASYNQSEETSSIKTTNYNGRYESASRGAMLTIDNLTFSYEL